MMPVQGRISGPQMPMPLPPPRNVKLGWSLLRMVDDLIPWGLMVFAALAYIAVCLDQGVR
jgi:hypothetical protein